MADKARTAINKAAAEEAAKGMDRRSADRKVDVVDEKTGEVTQVAAETKDIEGDILSEKGVDIDQVIRDMGIS